MLLMAMEQDDRIIWVVVEQHLPRGASAAASSSTSAGTGTAMRLKTLSWSGFGQIPRSEPSPNAGPRTPRTCSRTARRGPGSSSMA